MLAALGLRPPIRPITDVRTLIRAGGAGDIAVRYQAASARDIVVLVGGQLTNLDALPRVAYARLVYGGNVFAQLVRSESLANNSTLVFPSQVSAITTLQLTAPLFLPHGATDYLESRVESVATGEDATFRALFYGCDGGALVVTEVNA